MSSNLKPYKCGVCGEAFYNSNGLRQHVDASHSSKSPRDPPESSIRRNDSSSDTFTPPDSKKQNLDIPRFASRDNLFPCDGCNKVFAFREALRNHKSKCSIQDQVGVAVEMETKDKPIRSKYKNVAKSEDSPKTPTTRPSSRMKKRQPRKSPEKRRSDGSSCDECGVRVKNRHNMDRHMIEVHSGITHNCEVCNKKFTRRFTLLQHQHVHNSPSIVKCAQCGIKCANQKGLDKARPRAQKRIC